MSYRGCKVEERDPLARPLSVCKRRGEKGYCTRVGRIISVSSEFPLRLRGVGSLTKRSQGLARQHLLEPRGRHVALPFGIDRLEKAKESSVLRRCLTLRLRWLEKGSFGLGPSHLPCIRPLSGRRGGGEAPVYGLELVHLLPEQSTGCFCLLIFDEGWVRRDGGT